MSGWSKQANTAGCRVEEEVAEDVVLAVGRVGRAVQPLAVVAVGHRRLDLDDVLPGRQRERQPTLGPGVDVERDAVEARPEELTRLDVDEGLPMRRPP